MEVGELYASIFFVVALRVLAFQGASANLKGLPSTFAEAFSTTGLGSVPIPIISYVAQGFLFIVVNIIFDCATGVEGYFGHLLSLHIVNIFLINVTPVSPLYDRIVIPPPPLALCKCSFHAHL